MRVEIQGAERLMRKLAALGGNTDEVVRKSLRDGGKMVQGTAKANCAVDTGQLRNSITTIEAEHSVLIGTNVEHGVYVEFGTGQRGDPSVAHRQDWAGMAPQPFLGPALESNRKRIITRFTGNLKRAIRARSGGGGRA